jgi:23S rRNA (uracil1939-C5)-methyltransferase
MELELEINRLGAQGNGVAEGLEGPIFVPFTLPGERVRGDATTRGWSRSLSESRAVAPVCPHFGVCGGCALQHMDADAYLSWKRDQVVAALRSRCLDDKVEEEARTARQPATGKPRHWPRRDGVCAWISPRPLA